MDALDLEIVRWMYPNGISTNWGIDPRLRSSEIARRVGIRRETLWGRFRRWEREGFLRSFEVYPNVRLFDAHRYRADLRMVDTAAAANVLEVLDSIDGVIAGSSVFGPATYGPPVHLVCVQFVSGPGKALRDWKHRFQKLDGVSAVDGPFSEQPPPVEPAPTPLDWRVLFALRSFPAASVAELAKQVGVSAKTFIRRRNGMLSSRAIAYLPNFDWSVHPSAFVVLLFRRPEDRATIFRYMDERFRHYFPVSAEEEAIGQAHISEEFDPRLALGVRVPCRSQSDSLRIEGELSAIVGVTRVWTEVWGPHRRYYSWLRRALATVAENASLGEEGPTGIAVVPEAATVPAFGSAGMSSLLDESSLTSPLRVPRRAEAAISAQSRR